MLRSRSLARSLAALALIASLAACGGGAPAGTDGGAATMAVGVSGAQTVSFETTGGCGKALGDDASWGGMFTSPDSAWLLDITVEGTFDGGTYATADQATVFLTNGAGSTYDAMAGAGTVIVDAGARSGSIEATLTASDWIDRRGRRPVDLRVVGLTGRTRGHPATLRGWTRPHAPS